MRSVKLYNTMSNDEEIFKPMEPGKVSIYVCGVTTYDFSHIGHARAYVAFDVLYRYLLHLGYEVYYVRNFTDIDDKIIKRATELKEDPLDLSKRFCDEFLADMDALQCLSPTKQPRVTEHIEDIVAMIAKIIENDCAYTVDGDVYFSVDKSPSYGKLEDNRAGECVAVDSRKRNPADFALWKMLACLTDSFDHLRTLRDCEEALLPFRKIISDDKTKTTKIPPDAQKCIMKLQNDFYSAMSNDLLTPPLLNDSLQEAYTFANKSVTKLKKETQQSLFEGLSLVEKEIRKVLDVLGLLSVLPYSEVLQELNYKGLARAKITEEYLLQQIKLRHELRQVKEYHRADKIRRDLRALGIKLMDAGGGTTWKVSKPKVESST
ncbi:hypothetical protein V2J09_004886 [Rumex salicifolius]